MTNRSSRIAATLASVLTSLVLFHGVAGLAGHPSAAPQIAQAAPAVVR